MCSVVNLFVCLRAGVFWFVEFDLFCLFVFLFGCFVLLLCCVVVLLGCCIVGMMCCRCVV